LAVTVTGDRVDVQFLAPAGAEDDETTEEEAPAEGEAHEEEVPESDLNPIAPEPKELAWGFFYPRLHKGTEARNELIRSSHEEAQRTAAAANEDAAAYQAQLATVRGEVARRIDAARATLEQERSERLAAVNAGIAERRGAAAAELERAHAESRDDVEAAAREVAAAAARMATGTEPSYQMVSDAVRDAMSAGVVR
jgi:F0F1-type ATP synthase membrane subunit b/b'